MKNNRYNRRTDLIVDILNNIEDNNIKVLKRKNKMYNIEVLDIEILKDKNKLKKEPGKYITISFNNITDRKESNELENVAVKEIKRLFKYLKIDKKKKCLVIGLGNRESTPDSLGPKTVDNILVTKYLYDIKGIKINKNYRNVCAFTPDVKGNTGIESIDIILSLIDKIKPNFLIIIDALASSSIDRLNKTIQITNTSIKPGSGIYNTNKKLNYKKLNIPVISIGIPTVIDINILIKDLVNNKIPNYNMIVTSNDIDFIIQKASILLANIINKSLHQNFDI